MHVPLEAMWLALAVKLEHALGHDTSCMTAARGSCKCMHKNGLLL